MNESNWMCCTSCKKIVQLNNTGICLGCQLGFTHPLYEEKYDTKQGEDYAIKEREESESNISEYKNRDSSWTTKETSNSNSIECSRKEQKEKKEKWWKNQIKANKE